MKVAIDISTKKIIDELPANAKSTNTFLVNNGYRLLDLAKIYDEEGNFLELTDAQLAPYAMENANNTYNSTIDAITSDVPTREQLTWVKQESEARAWLADNTANTPFIDGMLSTRTKYNKAILVDKILIKADAYAEAVGKLTGARQHEEDILKG